jgi:hypothetical protein
MIVSLAHLSPAASLGLDMRLGFRKPAVGVTQEE